MKKTAEIAYTEYWVIRVIKDTKINKTVVKEIEFSLPPTEQDIIEVLMYCEPDEFISIAHNFKR